MSRWPEEEEEEEEGLAAHGMLSLHRVFEVLAAQLTHGEAAALSLLLGEALRASGDTGGDGDGGDGDGNGNGAAPRGRREPRDARELLLELERRGLCHEGDLGLLRRLLRLLARHDLLRCVTLKRPRPVSPERPPCVPALGGSCPSPAQPRPEHWETGESLGDTLGTPWGGFGSLWGLFGALWVSLGSVWGHLGSPGSVWGHFGVILGYFWGVGVTLGSVWGHFGSVLGSVWGTLGPIWTFRGTLGSLWGTWGVGGHSGVSFENSLVTLWSLCGHSVSPQVPARGSGNGAREVPEIPEISEIPEIPEMSEMSEIPGGPSPTESPPRTPPSPRPGSPVVRTGRDWDGTGMELGWNWDGLGWSWDGLGQTGRGLGGTGIYWDELGQTGSTGRNKLGVSQYGTGRDKLVPVWHWDTGRDIPV
uniref:DED domain-containing protein n=1 Tax=Junco hyemalis TaxID=40217 RepID=A0A8C5IJT6_JUNHY